MQVCNRCRANIDGKTSGAVLYHHDVDRELAAQDGRYKAAELCRTCFRDFVAMFLAWVKAGKRCDDGTRRRTKRGSAKT